jgi:hypothetical protein
MPIKAADQPDKTPSDWIEQIERSCSDLPVVDIRERFRDGGLFTLLDPILVSDA